MWWRRRESNPRPKAFRIDVYIHILNFNLAIKGSFRPDPLMASPSAISLIRRQTIRTSYPVESTPLPASQEENR